MKSLSLFLITAVTLFAVVSSSNKKHKSSDRSKIFKLSRPSKSEKHTGTLLPPAAVDKKRALNGEEEILKEHAESVLPLDSLPFPDEDNPSKAGIDAVLRRNKQYLLDELLPATPQACQSWGNALELRFDSSKEDWRYSGNMECQLVWQALKKKDAASMEALKVIVNRQLKQDSDSLTNAKFTRVQRFLKLDPFHAVMEHAALFKASDSEPDPCVDCVETKDEYKLLSFLTERALIGFNLNYRVLAKPLSKVLNHALNHFAAFRAAHKDLTDEKKLYQVYFNGRQESEDGKTVIRPSIQELIEQGNEIQAVADLHRFAFEYPAFWTEIIEYDGFLEEQLHYSEKQFEDYFVAKNPWAASSPASASTSTATTTTTLPRPASTPEVRSILSSSSSSSTPRLASPQLSPNSSDSSTPADTPRSTPTTPRPATVITLPLSKSNPLSAQKAATVAPSSRRAKSTKPNNQLDSDESAKERKKLRRSSNADKDRAKIREKPISALSENEPTHFLKLSKKSVKAMDDSNLKPETTGGSALRMRDSVDFERSGKEAKSLAAKRRLKRQSATPRSRSSRVLNTSHEPSEDQSTSKVSSGSSGDTTGSDRSQ